MFKIAFHPIYVHPLPEGHRFPMEKYDLLPRQLQHEGTADPDDFFAPNLIDLKWLEGIHSDEYVKKLQQLKLSRSEERQTGFPVTKELVEREFRIVEGTRLCTEYALRDGVAFNSAGGTHHAFRDRGEGFCLLNDQAVAANYLLRTGKANSILIVDLDVHQGNGTAAIFEQEANVFTFSVHGEHNYPLRKEKSSRDVGLPDGISTADYLETVEFHLNDILNDFHPDFVFYQCGVDIIETDKLGRLNVSISGCRRRDELVLSRFKDLSIPVVCTMGGGYSKEIRHIVEAHANTYRVAKSLYF
ncbi:histone deacetylase [Wandonia haliotis]|uniref:Histone deacetylase n=1 Tax=Wandonia haliotis TaxID=574963 RepID=A0ABN1MQN4_9FLAO